MICQNCGGKGMTVDEMKENGAKHWKQQALIQVLRAEAEEGFKRITYPIYDKELYKQAYFAAAEPREEKIAALKKENEELWTHSAYIEGKIAKATEIIKDLLLMAKVENLERNYESVDEAKQFLEEVKE